MNVVGLGSFSVDPVCIPCDLEKGVSLSLNDAESMSYFRCRGRLPVMDIQSKNS